MDLRFALAFPLSFIDITHFLTTATSFYEPPPRIQGRMKLTWSALVTAFAAVSIANAHFVVNFPGVRGQFDEDNEPQFCG